MNPTTGEAIVNFRAILITLIALTSFGCATARGAAAYVVVVQQDGNKELEEMTKIHRLELINLREDIKELRAKVAHFEAMKDAKPAKPAGSSSAPPLPTYLP